MTTNRRSVLAGAALACLPASLTRAADATLNIVVELPSERDKTGVLSLKNSSGKTLAGPFPAYGRSDNKAASRHGNTGRDPTHLFGDTPTGTYAVPRAVATGSGTAYIPHSYGPNGALVLKPVSGQALAAAANGRTGLLIHSGDPGQQGRLRATNGCVRLSNADMAALMSAIAKAGENPTFNRCDRCRALGRPMWLNGRAA
ncbi:MAG: L,D-transpeptidase family protein [Janthinobacterium lividum]